MRVSSIPSSSLPPQSNAPAREGETIGGPVPRGIDPIRCSRAQGRVFTHRHADDGGAGRKEGVEAEHVLLSSSAREDTALGLYSRRIRPYRCIRTPRPHALLRILCAMPSFRPEGCLHAKTQPWAQDAQAQTVEKGEAATSAKSQHRAPGRRMRARRSHTLGRRN